MKIKKSRLKCEIEIVSYSKTNKSERREK
uniref:Uncharacterized protein n=1 Tax=Arundo donax TaxID=35708 RepID=A0A0A8ZCS4_ARUDO